MARDIEAVHDLLPVVDELPGEPVPYCMASGEGHRYELGGTLCTIVARSQDTGGLFDAAYFTGGRGDGLPFHAFTARQRSLYVVNGSVQVWLGRRSRVLVPGDSVHAPAGTPVAFRMGAHCTRMLMWSAPGGGLGFVEQVGTPVDRHVHSGRPQLAPLRDLADAGEPFGLVLPDVEEVAAQDTWDDALPDGAHAYFLRSGEGDRRETGDSLNTYIARGANTGGAYFAIDTLGARAPYFIRHFHRQHTENFVCVSGRVWIYVNGREVLLTEGDFAHAPAGTVHTFAFAAHNTRMLGILTPDVFEPFFDLTGRPTELHVHPDGPNSLATSPAELAESDLDLVVVGPPPKRAVGLDI